MSFILSEIIARVGSVEFDFFDSFRMNNTYVILVLLFAFVSCTLSSYLDIPPPPERPMRFKTKEQIENYLKAVKDYYDAFKIKLVRRENSIADQDSIFDRSTTTDDSNGQIDLFKKIYHSYQQNPPTANSLQEQQQEENNLLL